MANNSDPLGIGGGEKVQPDRNIAPVKQKPLSPTDNDEPQKTLNSTRLGALPALARRKEDNLKDDEGVEGTAGLFELLDTDDLAVIAAHIKQNSSNITPKTLIETQRYAESEFGDTPDFDELAYTVKNVLDEKLQQAKRGITQESPNPIEARAGNEMSEKEAAAAGKGMKVEAKEHKVPHKKWKLAERSKKQKEAQENAARQKSIADASQREVIALNPHMRENVVSDDQTNKSGGNDA